MKKVLAIFFISISLFITCDNSDDASNDKDASNSNIIEVDYDIVRDRIWSKDSIYLLPDGLLIMAKLTIEPGTVIKIGLGQSIEVGMSGAIIAEGTSQASIVFTSLKDDSRGGDTNNDSDGTTPAKGDWCTINLEYSKNSVFNYCEFYYGGNKACEGALDLGSEYHKVTNCRFAYNDANTDSNNYYGALNADYADSATIIKNNIFYANAVPLKIHAEINLDSTNTFHNPNNPDEKNTFNGIFVNYQYIGPYRMVNWKESEVAFVISNGGLNIWNNSSLTLADNVVLKFMSDASLSHLSSAQIINFDGDGVAFTSYKDDTRKGDTNGDGAASLASVGDWEGIYNGSGIYYNWPNIYYSAK